MAEHPLRPLTLLTLANLALRFRTLILGLALGFATVAAIASFASSRTWSSSASFMAQARRAGAEGGLSALGAQLGISLGGAEAGQTPQFYLDLLKSREILGPAVDTRYRFVGKEGPAEGTLVDLYGGDHDRPAAVRRVAAIEELRDKVTAKLNARTGVITITVKTGSPQLSRAVADRLIGLLGEYNLQNRRSQASSERKFTERRLAEARNELRDAERRLESFMRGNREFALSPQLGIEHQRLTREVALRQEMYTGFVQAYEQARIEEIRDTPIFTIVESPELPALPDPRGTVSRTAMAFVGGLVLGLLIAAFRVYGENNHVVAGDELAEFRRLRRETVTGLRAPWKGARGTAELHGDG